jgi:hypothetical protein
MPPKAVKATTTRKRKGSITIPEEDQDIQDTKDGRKFHSTSVGEMANFDHQNKFKNLYSMDRGDKWEQTDSKIMNFGGLVLEI